MKQEIFLKDYQKPNFEISTVDLTINIFDEYTEVINTSVFQKINLPTNNLVLQGVDLNLQSVSLNGETPRYKVSDGTLIIENVPDQFTLTTVVQIKPQENTQLMGLYKSDGIFCTQCEPEGFRRITYHLDRPDVMSIFSCTITADKEKYPVLLSNGNPKKTSPSLRGTEGEKENSRHSITWSDPFKKPCYLFAMVAGNLLCTEDSFTTMSGRKIPLRIYTEAGTGNETRVKHAMDSLKKAMKWDEEKFGREYDLDIFMIVAVDAFNAGAMENKGLNIFNSSAILCDQKTATDHDFQWVEAVVAHEYFHNWTGNRITCRDWFQLTLKEGLTVYRDAEFSSDMGDRNLKRIEDASTIKEHQFQEDAGPMAHAIQPQSFVEIENFYTSTVYEKGAEVIRMLRTLFGEKNFRKSMDYYFDHFDGQAVTIHEFLESFEKALNTDLKQFKHSWYFQAGTPELLVTDEYNKEESTYTLHFTQKNNKLSLPFGKDWDEGKSSCPYVVPVSIGLLNQYGTEIKNQLHVVTEAEESVVFNNIKEEPLPSLLRNFSAPVKLQYQYSLDDEIFLFTYDTDEVNRYEAGQRMATQVIQKLMRKELESVPENVIFAYKELIKNTSMSDGFKAECLTLPGLYTLVQGFDYYSFHTAHIAKQKFLNEISVALQKEIITLYHKKQEFHYSLSQESIGARALKNMCLSYLSEGNDGALELIHSQFETANNMTDSIRSLALLCQKESTETQNALFDFERKWKNEPLVMNKWFAVQANSRLKNTLETIKQLEKHPCFDIKNPNKVRGLFGGLARNLPLFHAPDGSGYQFLSDKIIELDSINEKISSGLANAFRHYAYLSPKQQEVMKQSLEKILQTNGISSGLKEIIEKTINTKK